MLYLSLAIFKQSSNVLGICLSHFMAFFVNLISLLSSPFFASSILLFNALGICVNFFPNWSLAHSTQWIASSGNIFKVHWGISLLTSGSLWLEYDSVLNGITTWTWPLGPRVPLSKRGFLFDTQRVSTYLLALTLSKAFATKSNEEKNSSEKIFSVSSQTLSNLANKCPVKDEFICWAAAAAVELLGKRKCFSLNKNCLVKFDTSIISGSVIYIAPFCPVPTFNIAKFFINSHPIAPAPTISNFIFVILFNNFCPRMIWIPSNLFFFSLKFISLRDSSFLISISGINSRQSWYMIWLTGVYLFVIALMTSWAAKPPK